MSELTKDKLIAKLDEWFETVYAYGDPEDIQAYQQIRHLIESHVEASDMSKKHEENG